MRKFAISIAAVAALAVAPAVLPGDSGPEVRRTSGIMQTSMKVTPKGVRSWTPIIQHTLDLKAGDTVLVTARGTVTTEQKFVVLVGNFLKVSTNKTNYDTHDGTILERPMGGNIDRPMHHMPFSSSGAFVAPTDGQWTFTLVGYAASIHATATTYLKVDYGMMTTTVFRR